LSWPYGEQEFGSGHRTKGQSRCRKDNEEKHWGTKLMHGNVRRGR
jgi:hypothetical protein